MRILTVGSLPPEWGGPERGGVATFHATLLDGLLSRSDDVEVVGTLAPSKLARDVPVPSFHRPDDVGNAEFYERLLDRLKPDVVLMNHVAHTVGVTHARLASPPPAVGVVHSWHSITFRDGTERDRARETTEEALSGLAALVAPSDHCLREGVELGLTYPAVAERIAYPLQPLYLGRDVDVESRNRRGVAFLGNLIARKNPGLLVEAAGLLPATEFELIGRGDLEPSLRVSIAERGLGDRVRLAGLPDERHLEAVRDRLLGAEAMCLPSSSESFGLAFSEALACGTPVVGFGPTVREIAETMGVEIGAALDDPTPASVAAAIEQTVARDWDRAALRERATAAYGIALATDRYLGLFERVAGVSAAERP